GDGLVTQIPALLVSTSAGIIVTRAAADSTFGIDLTKQLFSYPRAMAIAGGLLLFLGVCGLPFMPILIISGTLFGMSYLLNRSLVNARIEEEERIRAREFEEAKKPEHVFSLVQVDPLEVEL